MLESTSGQRNGVRGVGEYPMVDSLGMMHMYVGRLERGFEKCIYFFWSFGLFSPHNIWREIGI